MAAGFRSPVTRGVGGMAGAGATSPPLCGFHMPVGIGVFGRMGCGTPAPPTGSSDGDPYPFPRRKQRKIDPFAQDDEDALLAFLTQVLMQ